MQNKDVSELCWSGFSLDADLSNYTRFTLKYLKRFSGQILLRQFWLALAAVEGKLKSLPSNSWVQINHWIFKRAVLRINIISGFL